MMKQLFLLLVFLPVCVSARAQTAKTFTVTNAKTAITASVSSFSFILRENSDMPTAVFDVVGPNPGDPAIRIPAGASYQFARESGFPIMPGTALGYIQATTPGPFTFVILQGRSRTDPALDTPKVKTGLFDIHRILAVPTPLRCVHVNAAGTALEVVAADCGAGGSGVPGGSDTQIQFNDAGAFNGDSQITWDKTNKVLGVGVPVASMDGLMQSYFGANFGSFNDFRRVGSDNFTVGLSSRLQSASGFGAFGVYSLVEGTGANTAVIGVQADVYSNVPNGQTNPNIQTSFETALSATGPGTSAGLAAFFPQLLNTGTGTVGYFANFEALRNSNSGGGVVNYNYGFRCRDQHGIGASLNVCLHIDDQGSGPNDYAIWVDGGKSVLKGPVMLGPTTQCQLLTGAGSPEGVVTANVCSLYLRTDGGESLTLYVKQSGTSNTGWGAK